MKRIYLVALLFAILTGIAVFNYSQYLQNSLQEEKGVAVVATKKIPPNTLITEDMIALKGLPQEAINSLAIKELSQAKGYITSVAIEADEQILTSRLNKKGNDSAGLAYTLPKGKRAITIEVDDITGVAGFIKKSNHVDVIAVFMMDEMINEKMQKVSKSVLLLQDTEVLEIDSADADKKSPGYKNITVAVTPEEAVKLFYAQTNGKITVVLRPVLEIDINNISPYAP